MKTCKTFFRSLFPLIVVAVVVGCKQDDVPVKGVIITGKIMKAGVPLEVPNREVALGMVDVMLVPLSGGVAEGGTQAAVDGTFKFEYAGKGLPPGKYRLAVYQRNAGPGTDMLEGRYSKNNSPIEFDFSQEKVGDTHDLGVIELDKYPSQPSPEGNQGFIPQDFTPPQ